MVDFIKKHRTTIILIGLGLGIILFAYLSISNIGERFFSKNDSPDTMPGIEEDMKKLQNIPLSFDQYIIQPRINTKVYEQPIKVKGIYVSGWIAGTKAKFNQLLDMVNRTELNAMVIDVKEDRGQLTYMSTNVALAKEVGAPVNMIANINQFMTTLKQNNVYPIARIVCFKDAIASAKRPELAIKTKEGSIWRDNKGNAWLNPYNKAAWDYLIDISKEAAQLGFKEIQYDYIRFPTDGNVKIINYGEVSKTKAEVIAEFLAYAEQELNPLGVDISADIFGIVPVVEGDYEKIGQDLELVSKDIDYICPMVYPSHYANVAQNGVGQKINGVLFKYPDLDPYGVVYHTLVLAKERIDKSQGKAKIRPWLQDFTASYLRKPNYQVYGGEQIRQQIQATYDSGFEEWILWNAETKYTEQGLLKQ
ncbi:MAG: putative glycoside hydrolase [Clostridia bacterium]